jgi:hypothetical protein
MQASDVPDTEGTRLTPKTQTYRPARHRGYRRSHGLTVTCRGRATAPSNRKPQASGRQQSKPHQESAGLDRAAHRDRREVISFPWYSETPSPEVINATSHLIGKLAAFAKLHRVNNKPDEPVENEKFAFRTFLIRLGSSRGLQGNPQDATSEHGGQRSLQERQPRRKTFPTYLICPLRPRNHEEAPIMSNFPNRQTALRIRRSTLRALA